METTSVKATASQTRPFTGAEYLESLKDDREVWIYGKRVGKYERDHFSCASSPRLVRSAARRWGLVARWSGAGQGGGASSQFLPERMLRRCSSFARTSRPSA